MNMLIRYLGPSANKNALISGNVRDSGVRNRHMRFSVGTEATLELEAGLPSTPVLCQKKRDEKILKHSPSA